MPKENTKFTTNKLLGRTKSVEKLETATKRAKLAENKIKKLKETFDKEMLELKEKQAKAMKFIFDDLDKKMTTWKFCGKAKRSTINWETNDQCIGTVSMKFE